jgi:acetyl-CoA acyltransferase
VLRALVERTELDPALVDDVITGCVGQAGEQALNIGRSAVLGAGFPESVPATSIDRQCGSSQQAAHFAAQGVIAGAYDIAIACGVESMSRVPMGTSPMGKDAFGPAVAARYPEGLVNQGVSTEIISGRWQLDRTVLDEFSARSHARAAATAAAGGFDDEILPITTENGTAATDETVRANTTVNGLGGLKPSFQNAELGADPERLNPRGGAIALGHPLGASGTRLLTTLVNHLEATSGRYGLQTMCEGGGTANATIIERL